MPRFIKQVILLLFLSPGGLLAQDQSYVYESRNFTTEDGLSHNAVSNIYEDSRGLYWITTRYGLNRFDGNNFRVYTREKHGIHSNTISHVLEDPDGLMWLLTGLDGLRYSAYFQEFSYSLFDPYAEENVPADSVLPPAMISDLSRCDVYTQLPDKSLVFVSKEGFFLHYRGKGDFRRVTIDIPHQRIIRIFPVADEAFFIMQGARAAPKDEYFNTFSLDGEKLNPSDFPSRDFSPKDFFISSYNLFPTGRKWVSVLQKTEKSSNQSNYLCYDETSTQKVLNIRDTFPFLPEGAILQFLDDTREEYWVKSGDTTLLLKAQEGIVAKFTHLDLGLFIRRDRHGNFLSTEGTNGLTITTFRPRHFKRTGLSGNPHRGLTKDHQGRLWINIGKYEYKNGIPKGNDSIVVSHNYALIRDSKGHIWSGKSDSTAFPSAFPEGYLVQYINGNKDNVRQFLIPDKNNSPIWSIWEDPETGLIWSASELRKVRVTSPSRGETINIFDKADNSLPTGTLVYDFTKGPDGNIWMSTSKGLYRINEQYEIIGRYSLDEAHEFNLPTSDIHHCYIDASGVFWLATGDAGLLRWKPDGSQPIRQYTISDGFPSMVLHATYEDSLGFLWIPSENGIIQFHKETELLTAYNMENGTSDTEYNRISHYQHKDGTLYFGGISGVTSFRPKDFHKSQTLAAANNYIIPIDVLQINPKTGTQENHAASFQHEGLITIYPRSSRATIKLRSPKLSNRHYLITSQIEDWQPAPIPVTKATVDLEGLPFGKQSLLLKAYDLSGNLLQTNRIKIRVIRPVYLRWWFISLFSVALFALSFSIIKIQTRRLRKLVMERTKTIEKDRQLIQSQAEKLRKTDRLKSRFFANISHELRTPLTLIMGPIKHILQRNNLPTESYNRLRTAYTNSERLQHMVKDILELTKLEENKLKVNTEPTDIAFFLSSLSALFESMAALQKISLITAVSIDAGTHLTIDQQKLETILRNLIGNAIKFTPAGGQILVQAKWAEDLLTVSVQDSGYGIAPEDLPYLFDRFFQAEYGSASTKTVGGTGIGLAICYELTQLMKGQISVSSEAEKGSTFTVELPATAVSEHLIEAYETQSYTNVQEKNTARTWLLSDVEVQLQSKVKNAGLKQARLLIVEDNLELQEYLSSILQGDFQLQFAAHGGIALKQLRENPLRPDLIITDLMMPEMDGFELLRHLKQDLAFSLIPTIALSARASLGDRLNTLRIGVDDYLIKPFQEPELIQRIHNLLANSNARKEAIRESLTPSISSAVPLSEVEEPTAAPNEAEENQAMAEDEAFLADLETAIRDNIRKAEFGNTQLAALFFISARTLTRRVKFLTGMKTNKFMLEIKLTVARELLESTPRPTVAQVAERIGFRKVSYFSSLFKERFGISPSEYYQ